MEKVNLTFMSDERIYIVSNRNNTTLDEHHHITVNKYPKCSCASFLEIHNTNISGKQPYVPSKHMCNLFFIGLACRRWWGWSHPQQHLESCFSIFFTYNPLFWVVLGGMSKGINPSLYDIKYILIYRIPFFLVCFWVIYEHVNNSPSVLRFVSQKNSLCKLSIGKPSCVQYSPFFVE